jgi:glycosyltransferase involved in cell wall biosynthesis
VPTVLFFRNFQRFTGADLKVWDYFNHVLATPGWNAFVRFSEGSVWDETNPWRDALDHVIGSEDAIDPDAYFVSGVDWRQIQPAIRRECPVPVINLVQAVKHACPNDLLLRYRFLPHKAIRICVSPEVEMAINGTGTVRGPTFVVPNGIDLDAVEGFVKDGERDVDLVIAANKDPELGARLAQRLSSPGRAVQLLDTRIPRAELLSWIARSRVALLLPRRKEGFYLPALEAMALGAVVVCPDCIGNRSYCLPAVNCLRPEYEEDAIAAAAQTALERFDELGELVKRARATARDHDIRREREAFHEILARADELWAER